MFIIPLCLANAKKQQLSNRLRQEHVTIRTLVLLRIHSATPLLFRLMLLLNTLVYHLCPYDSTTYVNYKYSPFFSTLSKF